MTTSSMSTTRSIRSRDAEMVETELMLADLESLEKRVPAAAKKAAQGDKEAKIVASVLGQALELLREGKPARLTEPKDEEEARVLRAGAAADRQAGALCLQRRRGRRRATAMPAPSRSSPRPRPKAPGGRRLGRDRERARRHGRRTSAREFLADARARRNRPRPRHPRRLRAARPRSPSSPSGPKEARAWTVHKGARAPQAAGEIHTDFERGFIRAETIAYDDYVALGGEAGAREAGKLRAEGKEYVVQDGDVMLFKFNV